MMERGPDDDALDPTQNDASELGMAGLLDSAGRGYTSLRRGDVVDGVVVRVDRDEVLVDIGVKSEAIDPANETGAPHGDPTRLLHVGDEVVAYVLQPEDVDGHVILSLTRAQAERGWRLLQKVFEDGETVEADVVEHHQGGAAAALGLGRGRTPLYSRHPPPSFPPSPRASRPPSPPPPPVGRAVGPPAPPPDGPAGPVPRPLPRPPARRAVRPPLVVFEDAGLDRLAALKDLLEEAPAALG